MCRGEIVDEAGSWITVCDEAGNLLKCQLCKASPTYWRNQPDPAPLPVGPCVLCGDPTSNVSTPSARYPEGRFVHPFCAEAWKAAHRIRPQPVDGSVENPAAVSVQEELFGHAR